MVDRECKQDLPALVTRITRRQVARSDDSPSSGPSIITAATITKRPIQTKETTKPKNKSAKKEEEKLPTVETYEALKAGRCPYYCVPCSKNFSRSSIGTHIKTKHKGKNTKVNCLLCKQKFDRHTKAQDHITTDHKVYVCSKEDCKESFSEFEKLKSHLRSSHDKSEWPWICGFCDQVLFYDLEFQVHIKKHTESGPFFCPLCNDRFSDTSKVCDHLADRHLPRNPKDEKSFDETSAAEQPLTKQALPLPKQTPKIKSSSDQLSVAETSPIQVSIKEESPKGQTPVEPEKKKESVLKEKVCQTPGSVLDKKPDEIAKEIIENNLSSIKMKDENAVNREIAALLLNLHASTRATPKMVQPAVQVPKPEDLSLKKGPNGIDSAIDLTKTKPIINTPLPATITKLVKSHTGVDLSGKNLKSSHHQQQPINTSVAAATSQSPLPNFSLPTAPTSYPFYPSLASMATLSPSLAMNSNYLLQNLLLGKMQQIVSASSATLSQSSVTMAKTVQNPVTTLSIPASSLPTHPLPAQALPMQSSTSLKPPASIFKTTSIPHSTTANQTLNFTNPMTLTCGTGGETTTTTVTATTATSIPLLCGQIVSQLNGLLFLVHGINNPTLEMNLQTQLTTIHARLQEIVTMVEQVKKAETEMKNEKLAKESMKQKEEEKIVAKHIQDYQRALLKQQEDNTKAIVANGGHKGNYPVDLPEASPTEPMELQEAESTSGSMSAAARRRRGRPPKNSNLDLSYSPPEKQMKTSLNQEKMMNSESSTQNGEILNGNLVNGSQMGNHQNGNHANSNSSNSLMQANNTGGGGGKGSKGIRNRVFCGECCGCLKNDDCGKCRYCKDKTKFGGQNRLRQKCLHRRCQMDTHRRRSSHNGQGQVNNSAGTNPSDTPESNLSYEPPRQSPSPNTIYSGVDLANKLQQHQQQMQEQMEREESHTRSPIHNQVISLESLKNGDFSKTLVTDRSASSASNGSATSDDDGDDQKTGKSQSRIDKWKAKHEAMLKLAQKTDKTGQTGDKNMSEKNAEILNLDPASGVCIDFDGGKEVGPKPHSRHNGGLQQALSV